MPAKGEKPGIESGDLREKAREVLRAGKLPGRAPDGLWGGRGTGATCEICGAPTTQSELEFELEFSHDGDDPGSESHFVHQRCFSMLEVELELENAALGVQVQTLSTGAASVARSGRSNGSSG